MVHEIAVIGSSAAIVLLFTGIVHSLEGMLK